MPKYIVLSTVLVITLGGCLSDTLDASYNSLSDAVAANAVDKGWIPEWLPRGATNLREASVSALAFDIPGGEIWRLPEHCVPTDFAETVPSQFGRSWWPSESSLASSYKFFQCKADGPPDFEFVAISTTGTRGLHWRTYAR